MSESVTMTTGNESESDLLNTYRTSPYTFPLHVVSEDGSALCGNLSGKQLRLIEKEGFDVLPTVSEKRDGEEWKFFHADLCGNCRSILLSELGEGAAQKGWEERQAEISDSENPNKND
jgi:hypothetical protein